MISLFFYCFKILLIFLCFISGNLGYNMKEFILFFPYLCSLLVLCFYRFKCYNNSRFKLFIFIFLFSSDYFLLLCILSAGTSSSINEKEAFSFIFFELLILHLNLNVEEIPFCLILCKLNPLLLLHRKKEVEKT